MSQVTHRITLAHRTSVNTPDFIDPPWAHNLDRSPVEGVPTRYHKIAGDVLSVMDAAEQAVVDAALEEARKDGQANQLDSATDLLVAFALVMLDEVNALRSNAGLSTRTVAQLKTAIKGKL